MRMYMHMCRHAQHVMYVHVHVHVLLVLSAVCLLSKNEPMWCGGRAGPGRAGGVGRGGAGRTGAARSEGVCAFVP